jgi:hypothetical protein
MDFHQQSADCFERICIELEKCPPEIPKVEDLMYLCKKTFYFLKTFYKLPFTYTIDCNSNYALKRLNFDILFFST